MVGAGKFLLQMITFLMVYDAKQIPVNSLGTSES